MKWTVRAMMRPSQALLQCTSRTCSSQLNQSRTTRSHHPANSRRPHKPTFTVASPTSKNRRHRRRVTRQSLQRHLRAHHSADSLPACRLLPSRLQFVALAAERRDPATTPQKVVKKTKIVAASFDEKIAVDGDTEMANDEGFRSSTQRGPMKV